MTVSDELVKAAIADAFAPVVRAELLNRKETFTVEEAAEFLTVKKNTLDHWRSNGEGPRFSTLGRRIVYRRDDLVKFIEDNAVRVV
ncbi:DNA-binding protein [Marinifilum sp. JC120]|nr:DNA-binding protein [Marinifilum sp. JC120]